MVREQTNRHGGDPNRAGVAPRNHGGAVGPPSPAQVQRRSRLIALGVIGVMLVPLALSILLHRSDDRTTATVTLAQVHAQPEATLLYPRGTLVATTAMTGTTILIARYQNYGCPYRNCHTFIGYDSPRVNGGYVSRLFTTGDSSSQVLTWYRREMARRGWTLGVPRHSRNLDLTRFIRIGQLPNSCQPDDFALYTGQPRAVSAIVGKPVAQPSRRQTLFATRYTLYPDDAAQVLSNYCPLGALRQWHEAMPSTGA